MIHNNTIPEAEDKPLWFVFVERYGGYWRAVGMSRIPAKMAAHTPINFTGEVCYDLHRLKLEVPGVPLDATENYELSPHLFDDFHYDTETRRWLPLPKGMDQGWTLRLMPGIVRLLWLDSKGKPKPFLGMAMFMSGGDVLLRAQVGGKSADMPVVRGANILAVQGVNDTACRLFSLEGVPEALPDLSERN